MGGEIFKIAYIGNDKAYMDKLKVSLKQKCASKEFSIKQFSFKQEKNIQAIISDLQYEWQVILLDYSQFQSELVSLARLIKRINGYESVLLMALYDQQIDNKLLYESIMTGVKFHNVKNQDQTDVVYSLFSAIEPDAIEELNYAVAELSDEAKAVQFLKGGYITLDRLHAEGNTQLKVDDEVNVTSFLNENKILNSSKMKVKKISTENIFYNFKYAYDFEFKYVDLDESSDADKYVSMVEDVKYRLNKWILKSLEQSLEKKTKIFVIDRFLNIYRQKTKIDTLPYHIRSQPFLKDAKNEIDKMQPQIIVYAFDSEEVLKQNPTYKNNEEQLQQIIQVIKAKENYDPFIIVFDMQLKKDDLVKKYGYEKFLVINMEIDVDYLLKMAEIFQAKLAKVTPPAKKQIFLTKESPLSILELNRQICIKSLSEIEISFTCNFDPECHEVIMLGAPFHVFATVVPARKNSKLEGGAYRAIINGLGEDNKEKLRQFINAVYFRELEESKAEDKEEQEKLRQDFIKKKEEAEKAAEEAKQKEQENNTDQDKKS